MVVAWAPQEKVRPARFPSSWTPPASSPPRAGPGTPAVADEAAGEHDRDEEAQQEQVASAGAATHRYGTWVHSTVAQRVETSTAPRLHARQPSPVIGASPLPSSTTGMQRPQTQGHLGLFPR